MESSRRSRHIGRACSAVVPCAMAILLLALSACAGAIEHRPVPTAGAPEPTATPRPIDLPADEGAHEDRLEWWYYNGHLTADDGREFGYHLALFQRTDDSQDRAYVGQFSITDVSAGTHRHSAMQSASPELGYFGEFDFVAAGWIVRIDEDSHEVSVTDGSGIGIDLSLRPVAPPMLHNRTGWLGYFGWTYYYSWPRMVTQGTLTVDGTSVEVVGESWFDHQWGDFFVVGAPAGWQWFAILLDDGSALKLTFARDAMGRPSLVYGTLQHVDGTVRHLDATDLSIEPTGEWSSPATGAVYPSGWLAKVLSEGVELTITPDVDDQEVTTGVPPGATYWEGKSTVSGVVGGRPVSGFAYVELTGYVEPPTIPWRD